MRKISFIMAALALVLGVTQCKKENKPVASGETQRIVLTASNGNDGSKVAVDEATTMLNLTWESTDVIMASGAVEGTLSYKSGAESDKATFEGSVTRKEGEQVVFTVGAAPTSFEGQTGSVDWIKSNMHLKGTADYNEDGVYGTEGHEVEMKLQYAVLKLDLSALGTEDGTVVTISNGSTTVATVAGVKTATKVYYVAMPAAESTEYTFSSEVGTKTMENAWTLENNIFYTKNDGGGAIVIELAAPTKPDDALSGLFSVSDGKQVWFSPGNLQYVIERNQEDVIIGGTWQFAANQYDIVETGNVGNNYEVAEIQTLFGWGDLTPLRTDEDDLSYSWIADWGTKIDNKETWRTLHGDEWIYLLTDRTIPGGKPLYTNTVDTPVTIDHGTYNGLFIYPDDYSGNEVGVDGTTDTWEKINDLGIVFLPAAGFRDYMTADYVGTDGYYWSSSPFDDTDACNLYFGSGDVTPNSGGGHHYGFSVRLVSVKKN